MSMPPTHVLTAQRRSGLLLHPSCLPGKYGIGDLGTSAYQFADFLQASGQRYWQVLPLCPPDVVHSPYQSTASLAGNPLLLSLDTLVAEGWLTPSALQSVPTFPTAYVHYDAVLPWKNAILRTMANTCATALSSTARLEFERFCAEQHTWLEPFAHFMALKEANGGVAWTQWQQHNTIDPVAITAHKFLQWQFFHQWQQLRDYCHARDIAFIGDVPIYVAHDSADVWGHPELFNLDAQGQPQLVAGVPPDYFSATGQLWGNPVYRWDVMADTGFAWWCERVRTTLNLVDAIRLDHFRGFEQYYAVPFGAQNAIVGAWFAGPGDGFFAALQDALGTLPFIAEDLGIITPEVTALRQRWDLPGMRVLQFAFGSDDTENPHLPHNYERPCVVYTGTHDNDTTVGWFHSADTATQQRALQYLPGHSQTIHWDMIRAVLASVATVAIFPLQDVLGLDTSGRMNVPGRPQGNWRWRFHQEQLQTSVAERLHSLTRLYGRCHP